MKLVRIKNKQGVVISDNNTPTDLDYFLNENISLNSWGKPERWVLQDSESYELSDVLKTEERIEKYIDTELNELGHTIEVEKEVKQTWVLLAADYTIEVIDLESDPAWLLEQCHKNRREAYLPISDFVDAMYWKEKGDDSKFLAYIKKCEEVKAQYPLPKVGS